MSSPTGPASAEPTGRVDVTVDGASHASYVFAPDCAWDNVPWSDSFQRLAADSTAEVERFLGRSVA